MLPNTFPSLEEFEIKKSKPLLICDADEVIFDFMNSFEKYLEKKNLYFNWNSYALEGNIIDNNNNAVEKRLIKKIIDDFFLNNTFNMRLISGAKESLNRISKAYNIIILSNIPFRFYDKRLLSLKKNGFEYPFFANQGTKGKTIKFMSKKLNSVWFIDDSPYQIKSVKLEKAEVNTILYVNNTKLASLITQEKCWDYYSNHWKQNEKILLN